MTDELKDIIYADLFRYTGNARRYKNIYACYLEERRSSPEFSYISVMRRTRYYADQIKKYDGIRKKLYQLKFGVSNYRLDRLSRKYHFQIPYDTDILHISDVSSSTRRALSDITSTSRQALSSVRSSEARGRVLLISAITYGSVQMQLSSATSGSATTCLSRPAHMLTSTCRTARS